ncbi:MAG: carbamoyl phosphate synthase small subunit [Firmicutes bacterium HGW-Firmicutes-21]|nr:MAG: carbamoyl phosphate synthase small subunit [Firmicutes bacterium HGW-Firmicutes-21]
MAGLNCKRKIVLESGQEFCGEGFGARTDAICELVFNTSMVGYQEIISDPSYTYQMVVMTYPLIGNYGITDEDFETKTPTIGGLIVREYNDMPSNFRYTKTLSEILEENQIPAISGVDTRMIGRIIRDYGSCKVMITDESTPLAEALERIKQHTIPSDAVAKVSCKKTWYSRTPNHKYNVVAIDCGMKLNIIRKLNEKSCNVTVVPYNTSSEEIMALKPDGLFLSNGPGNPEDVKPVIEVVKELRGRLPIFGICLGHQMISLACGARTFKMKFGHRGGNHPIKNLENGKIEITSQNHSYAVDRDSVNGTCLKVTHINLLDNTVEGVESSAEKLFSVQYHPESAPGPQDSTYLFDRFIDIMRKEATGNA